MKMEKQSRTKLKARATTSVYTEPEVTDEEERFVHSIVLKLSI